MASETSSKRLSVISGHVNQRKLSDTMSEMTQAPDQLPWNPNCTTFPSLKDLPQLPGAPEGAAWVWGEDDQVQPSNGYCTTSSSEIANEIGTAGKIESSDTTAGQGICTGDPHGRDGATRVCSEEAWRNTGGN